jgi:hypothetical protein
MPIKISVKPQPLSKINHSNTRPNIYSTNKTRQSPPKSSQLNSRNPTKNARCKADPSAAIKHRRPNKLQEPHWNMEQ